ncbi:TonB-dependent receptor [Caulobacter mirabilis]|uniref:TonB-dependent receptor n=1 Tax=Caulobacter mirabilis TaxID=69666 RepID=A0A2D2B0G8_9CAUL|nr:TonB-dependent receptor [Caulobacter mirabilis]ATQ43687.1 TonB-dependent receptor [Caulobacter mirabilis]
MKSFSGRALLASTALCGALGVAAPAVAQDDGAASVEEVIVTAQRREQRLLDVPASVAAVGADAIKDLNIQQVSELSSHVPNLAIDSSTSLNSAVYIRGVGANSRNIGFDTRVGVYMDGVYLGQSPALNQELVDLERVEVLRGPQGALFGKNTVAGAINLISRRPSFDREGYVGLRLGNHEEIQATARYNLPLSDTLAAKLSVNRAQRDGFTKNLYDGSTVGNRDVWSWRAQLRWEATEALSVNISADGLVAREAGEYGNAFTNTFGTALTPGYLQPRTVNLDHQNRDERDVYGAAVEIAYRLASGPTFKSITAWRSTDFFSTNDLDYSPLDLLSVDFDDSYDQYTQEFQLVSGGDGPLGYVAGLYLYQQDSETKRTGRVGSLGPALGVAPGTTLPTAGDLRTRNIALYGNAEYEITEKLTLGAGFRWSWEEKVVDYMINGAGLPALGLATGRFSDSRVDRDFSPTVTATYAFQPRLTGFLRYAKGYKSGGYNLDFVSKTIFPGNLEFEKETASSFEGGLKGELFERRLSFSVTAFQTTFENYQVDQFQQLAGGGVAIVIGNASEVRSRGVELEGVFRPGGGLSIDASLGLQDVEFTSFPGGGSGGADASGKRVPGAAKVQAALGVTYVRPIGDDFELLLHADYSYRGSYYSDIDNLETVVVGGVTVPFDKIPEQGYVNGRIALSRDAQGWEVALWGRNLFDEDNVQIYGGDIFGTRTRRFTAPRTWGVELSARF